MYHTAGRLALILSLGLLNLDAVAQTNPTDSISESRDSVRHISEVVVYARQMLGSKF